LAQAFSGPVDKPEAVAAAKGGAAGNPATQGLSRQWSGGEPLHRVLGAQRSSASQMPWNLDDLEDDDEFAEVDPSMQEHLHNMQTPDMRFQHTETLDSLAEEPLEPLEPYTFPDPRPGKTPMIFLKIEGVLAPQDSAIADEQLSQLKRIVDASKAQIVLTSGDRSVKSVRQAAEALEGAGIVGLIGMTDSLEAEYDGSDLAELRVNEIGTYLEEKEDYIDEDHWVALDDCGLDTETEDGVKHTVQTDRLKGLTATDADAAISLLTAAAPA